MSDLILRESQEEQHATRDFVAQSLLSCEAQCPNGVTVSKRQARTRQRATLDSLGAKAHPLTGSLGPADKADLLAWARALARTLTGTGEHWAEVVSGQWSGPGRVPVS